MQTDGRTDMAKPTVAFRNFANVPKNCCLLSMRNPIDYCPIDYCHIDYCPMDYCHIDYCHIDYCPIDYCPIDYCPPSRCIMTEEDGSS